MCQTYEKYIRTRQNLSKPLEKYLHRKLLGLIFFPPGASTLYTLLQLVNVFSRSLPYVCVCVCVCTPLPQLGNVSLDSSLRAPPSSMQRSSWMSASSPNHSLIHMFSQEQWRGFPDRILEAHTHTLKICEKQSIAKHERVTDILEDLRKRGIVTVRHH